MICKRQNYMAQVVIWILVVSIVCVQIETIVKLEGVILILVLGNICLAIGTKLSLTNYISKTMTNIINALALSSMCLHILILFLLYLTTIGEKERFSIYLIWSSNTIFNTLMLVIIMGLIFMEIRPRRVDYMVGISFVISVLSSNLLVNNKELVQEFGMLFSKGAILGCCIYVFIGKKYKKELGKGIYYFRYFTLCNFAQCLCYTFNTMAYFAPICLTLHFFRNYYLLRCALTIGIEQPMSKKIFKLEAATNKIDDHSKMSMMIVNLSHELKTPINVIKSAIDLLSLDYRTNQQLDKEIKELKAQCNQSLNIVQMMIDIQKIKSGQISFKCAQYNVVELIENVIEALSEEYRACRFIFNPQEEEINSFVSKELLQQAFLQLLYLMLQIDDDKIIYVHMRRREGKPLEIELFHSSINQIEETLRKLNDFYAEEEMMDILSIQYLQEVIKLHQGSIEILKNEKSGYMQLCLPIEQSETSEITQLGEENILELRENIRCHYLI